MTLMSMRISNKFRLIVSGEQLEINSEHERRPTDFHVLKSMKMNKMTISMHKNLKLYFIFAHNVRSK